LDEKTKQKIWILTKKEFGRILDLIDPDQLEKKYGGILDEISKYWPPIDTLKSVNFCYTRKKKKKKKGWKKEGRKSIHNLYFSNR
jgi:hypothetical protein